MGMSAGEFRAKKLWAAIIKKERGWHLSLQSQLILNNYTI